MSFIDAMKGKAALLQIANREGKSLAEIEEGIRKDIELAWANPEAREYQNMLFPKGKPTPAEFVGRMARQIKCENREKR